MAFDYVNSSLLQTNSLEYLKSLANSCQNYSALGHDDYHYKFMIYEYPNGISYYLYCGRLKTNSTAFDTFNIKFKYIDLYYKDDGTTSYTYNNDFKEAPSYSYFSVINSNYLFHCFTDITSDYPMTCPNLLSSSSVDNVSNNSSGGSSSVDFILYYQQANFYPEGYHTSDWSSYDGPENYGKRCKDKEMFCGVQSLSYRSNNIPFFSPMTATFNGRKKTFLSQVYQIGLASASIFDNSNLSLKYNFEKGKKYSVVYHFTPDIAGKFYDTATNNYTCNFDSNIKFSFLGNTGFINYIYNSSEEDYKNVFDDLRFNIRHSYTTLDGEKSETDEIILYIEFIPKRTYTSLSFYIGDSNYEYSPPLINYSGNGLDLYNYDDFKLEYGDNMNKHWSPYGTLEFTDLDVMEVDDFIYSEEEDKSSSCWIDTVPKKDEILLGDDYLDCDTFDISCHVSNIWTMMKKAFFGIIDFFKTIFKAIKDFIVSIFVPRDGFIDNQIDELNKDLEKELGILYFPLSLVQRVFQRFNDFEGKTDVIHIPSINIPFFGKLIDETYFDINSFFNSYEIKPMYDIYLVLVWSICSITLARFCYSKMRQYFGGGLL